MSTVFFVTEDLTLEDVFVAIMEDGLMMDIVIKVLLGARKMNARKVVEKASEFIWKKRKCKFMQNQWKVLENEFFVLFLHAVKTLFQ